MTVPTPFMLQYRSPRPAGLLIRTLLLLCGLAGASAIADTPSSEELAEVRAGERHHEQKILGDAGYVIWNNPEMARYIDAVGQRLARVGDRPTLPFRFFLIDSKEFNAFATMGGYVYVTRGLLSLFNSEAQLASVMAHEIGHINHRHLLRRESRARNVKIGAMLGAILTGSGGLYETIQQTGGYGVAKFGRTSELEADRSGLRYILAAGYEAEAAVDALSALFDYRKALQSHGLVVKPYHGINSTHPKEDRRLYELVRQMKTVQPGADYAPIREDYLEVIDGIPWQDTVNDGLVRDGSYYNGRRGIVVAFPDDWRVDSGGNFIKAQSRRGAWIQLETYTLDESEAERDPPRLERFLAEELNIEIEGEGRRFEAEGFPGLLAFVPAPPEQDGYARRMVAVIFKDRSAFVLRGENLDESDDRAYIDAFARTVGSFRRITEWELENIRGQRIVVRRAEPGWTYDELARRASLGPAGGDLLRVINSDYPNGEPLAGDRIKLIE